MYTLINKLRHVTYLCVEFLWFADDEFYWRFRLEGKYELYGYRIF